MSTQGLESIEHTVQLTHSWINDLDAQLGWNDRHRSYQLLRGVLQALRDWVAPNEAADFAAQLPTLLRGVYYEHYRPGTTPVEQHSKAAFLDRIERAMGETPVFFAEEAVSMTFSFLNGKISAGEIKDVHQSLPHDLRALWRISPRAA